MQVRVETRAWLLLGGLAVVLAALIARRHELAGDLQWLRLHRLFGAGVAVFLTATAVAQRRALQRNRFSRSWLAAVPVKPWTARGEALLIEAWPAAAAAASLLLLAVMAMLVLPSGLFAPAAGIVGLWAYISGAIALGVGLSYGVPQPKPVDLPPGSRYVPKPSARRAAAFRASYSALGLWPIRQMFAWAQPKVVSRAIIPILLMMPMGTTADAAMIAIAMFGLLFAMTLLWSAAISASRAARRWLAPLPPRAAALFRAFLLPVWSVMAGASAAGSLLLLVFNVPFALAAKVGAVIAMFGCLTIGGALLWNLRPRRTP